LFAATMLKKNFNIDTHIAYTAKPIDPDNYRCSELVVGWGHYDRLADPLVLPRAKWLYEQIYSQAAQSDEFFAALSGTSSLMSQGLDWCVNLDNDKPPSAAGVFAGDPATSTETPMHLLELDRLDYRH